MSHWLPTSGPDSTSFHPCPGCFRHVPKYATLSHIKRRCTSELCFFHAPLDDTITYPTRNAKVFATGRPIILSTTLRYTSSLALSYFNRLPVTSDDCTSSLCYHDEDDEVTLPASTVSIFTNGSYLAPTSRSLFSMSYAWLALDNDNLVLESSSDTILSFKFPIYIFSFNHLNKSIL
ncbi:hypothetical protein RhiirA4_456421 [Rhizophagus irregularis]|uniref:Uncharacterized protein n=1 Tax=Rhizophagus irregularis TaxID=588596 RepID=A0A2I1G7P0_9GLOM|nr:hypothetical protein RhiirA4_456421 [Rhizophagus irregularis]